MSGEEAQTMTQLVMENMSLRKKHDKLVEHNMRLLLLLKEKEQKVKKQELIIRKYRSRLVRWFEDMQYDPMEEIEAGVEDADVDYTSDADQKEVPKPGGTIKVKITRKAADKDGEEGDGRRGPGKRARLDETPSATRGAEAVAVPPTHQRAVYTWSAEEEALFSKVGPGKEIAEYTAAGLNKTETELTLHARFVDQT